MRGWLSPAVLGIVAVAAGATGRDASAQGIRPRPTGTSAPITSPYMSPAMNPFLNPALTVAPMNRNDALLYFWASQQQPGALLGPRLDRSRPDRPRAAEIPTSLMTPGGGAARYFQRGNPVAAGGTGRRYHNIGRYFGNNGR
jgi:hypothetical protein